MFARHTRDSIIALACVDEGVTENEKRALTSLLSNRERVSPVIRYKDAAEKLGVSLATVKRLVAMGILKKVVNGGKRAYGVTEESLVNYAS